MTEFNLEQIKKNIVSDYENNQYQGEENVATEYADDINHDIELAKAGIKYLNDNQWNYFVDAGINHSTIDMFNENQEWEDTIIEDKISINANISSWAEFRILKIIGQENKLVSVF